MRHDASLQLTTCGCSMAPATPPWPHSTAVPPEHVVGPGPPFPFDACVINADAGIDEEGEADQHEQDARERERLGARGEERSYRRRHPEIIGVALLQAERAGRVAEALEDVRKQ